MSMVYEEYDSFSVGTRRSPSVCVWEREKLRRGPETWCLITFTSSYQSTFKWLSLFFSFFFSIFCHFSYVVSIKQFTLIHEVQVGEREGERQPQREGERDLFYQDVIQMEGWKFASQQPEEQERETQEKRKKENESEKPPWERSGFNKQQEEG